MCSVPRTLLRMTRGLHLRLCISSLCYFGNLNQSERCPWEGSVTLNKERCESQPGSPRSCEVEGFLPETQGNLCGEHTVGSCELALAYRQIAGRAERGRKGRHSLLQARELTGAGHSREREGRSAVPERLHE